MDEVNTLLLKSKRIGQGLRQKDIAKQMKIDKQSYYKKENNKVDFTRREVIKIVKILNLTPEEKDKIFFTV